MFIFDIDRWVEIWVTITRNKTRSLLSGFGVFWGILMLVSCWVPATVLRWRVEERRRFSTTPLLLFDGPATLQRV